MGLASPSLAVILCRGGQLTPPGLAEAHLATQKRWCIFAGALFSLTAPGKKAPGTVFQMSILTLRTLQTRVGRLRGRGQTRPSV